MQRSQSPSLPITSPRLLPKVWLSVRLTKTWMVKSRAMMRMQNVQPVWKLKRRQKVAVAVAVVTVADKAVVSKVVVPEAVSVVAHPPVVAADRVVAEGKTPNPLKGAFGTVVYLTN
jgi:hypothetical protein